MLKLVKLSTKYQTQLTEMMDEWTNTDEEIIPFSIRRLDYHDFDTYVQGFEDDLKGIPPFVPASTFFCLDIERNIFVGAINIRHTLNEFLLHSGGHIGDGIRPSERRKGYATEMIRLGLEECKKLNIEKVLMVCDKNNIGSAKSIIRNGGILENEIESDEGINQRYWITL